jgi:hypothetical protein
MKLFRDVLIDTGISSNQSDYMIDDYNISENLEYTLESIFQVENGISASGTPRVYDLLFIVKEGTTNIFYVYVILYASSSIWYYNTFVRDAIHSSTLYNYTSGNFSFKDFKYFRFGFKLTETFLAEMYKYVCSLKLIICDTEDAVSTEVNQLGLSFDTGYIYSSRPQFKLAIQRSIGFYYTATNSKFSLIHGPYYLYFKSAILEGFIFDNPENLLMFDYLFDGFNIAANQIYVQDYRLEIKDLQTELSSANLALSDAQTSLDLANDKIDDLQNTNDEMASAIADGFGINNLDDLLTALQSYEAQTGSANTREDSDRFTPIDTDRFQTRLSGVIDSWVNSFTGGMTYGDYDCHLTGLLGGLRGPINYFVNTILDAVKRSLAGALDGLKSIIHPVAGFIDSVLARLGPVLAEGLIDILNWLKVNLDFMPFVPEVCTMYINIINGSDIVTEIAAMIDAEAGGIIDSVIDIVNAIVHVFDYVINYTMEMAGVELEWYDLTEFWNRFVSLIAEDDSDTASIGLYATRIGFKTQAPGTLLIPKGVHFNNYNYEIDTLDLVLEFWCSYRLPIIHPASIPIPLGGSYITLKDIKVPLSEYLAWSQTSATHFGGLTSGFTVKDITFDVFCMDLARFIGTHLGIKGKQAFLLAIKQLQKRLQPTIKDVIKRIAPADEPLKYNSSLPTLWDIMHTVNTQNEFLIQYSIYLAEYAEWLRNPRTTSRPLAPVSPFS